MTTKNPTSGNDVALPKRSLVEEVRARIALWCKWFGCEPVKVRARNGSALFSEDLVAWAQTNGAELDWLLFGNVELMAGSWRAKALDERQFIEAVRKASDHTISIIATGLKAHADGVISFDDAMKAIREAAGIAKMEEEA